LYPWRRSSGNRRWFGASSILGAVPAVLTVAAGNNKGDEDRADDVRRADALYEGQKFAELVDFLLQFKVPLRSSCSLYYNHGL
jgi:hypothetical protein